MRLAVVALLSWTVTLGVSDAARAADGVSIAAHGERVAQLRALRPRPGPASVRLAESASVVEVGPAHGVLVGGDARRFMRLTQGVDYPRVEAVVVGGRRGFVFIEWFDSGHVSLTDWHELDPARLMNGIRRATAAANARRRAAAAATGGGVGGIEVIGWVERPRPIGAGDGVRWAIGAVEGGGRITVNAIALRLGRRGYQKLTWVGAEAAHAAPDALLDEVLRGHRFRPGHGHADGRAGDPVAPFGIASLVTVATGAAPPEPVGDATALASALAPKAWPALLPVLLWLGWAAARAAGFGRPRFLFAALPGQHKRHDRRDS